MPCEFSEHLLGSYLDAELDAASAARVKQHVAACAACAAKLEQWREIGAAVRKAGPAPMPEGLAARVARRIEQARQTAPVPPAVPAPAAWRWMAVPALVRQAAVLLMACGLTALATWWTVATSERGKLVQREQLSAHIRTLMQEMPVQVASADGHVVRPWFAGKVDVAPPVKDLAAQGFPLVGGRVDYLGDRRVAALVYKRRLHVINVFAWPETTSAAPRSAVLQGYNIVTWSSGGIGYSAVSDLNGAELQELQQLLQ